MADASEPHSPTTPPVATVPSEEETPRAASPSAISRLTDAGTTDGGASLARTGTPSQGPSSPNQGFRRGYNPTRSNSNAAASSHTNTRPGSASSRMSRRSRTHVSSMTPQGFFRPMSSQRLQAHRSGRPMTQEAITVEDNEDESENKRVSIISNSTLRHAMEPPSEAQEVPPSRGTEFTEAVTPDRNTSNASPTGNTTIRSLGESVQLLKEKEKKPTLSRLSINNNLKTGSALEPPKQSPLSLRSGFLSLPGRNESQENRRNSHHERLSSVASSPRFMKGPSTPAAPRLGKNYEYFTGNTVFWGSGRFQNSRDKPVNIITGILVLLPVALFFAYSAPWLWHNISPAIPIVFAYMFFVCFSSFVHASVVDPGILPRNLHSFPSDDNDDPLALGPPLNDWVTVKLATSEVSAMDVPVKYCKTCNIWRPPRCYHCRWCDNCVETLDHHCVWLNNCVGRRNYRYFFTFVSSSTLLALFLVGASLAHILVYRAQQGISFGAAIDHWRVPFAMVIYGVVGAPYPASLWGYHVFLMSRGETTREYLASKKFLKADRHRPFTQGNILRNWIAVLCRPRPPTYLQFKRPYERGDQRLAKEKRRHRQPDLEAQADMEMQTVRPTTPGPAPPTRPASHPTPASQA